MNKSQHKDYLEIYWKNWSKAIENEILPCQERIFELLSVKFNYDAKKDLDRKRIKLHDLWKKCWTDFSKIHSILTDNQANSESYDEDRQEDIVQEIVDMTYWSVEELYKTLKEKYEKSTEMKEKYSSNPEIYQQLLWLLEDICKNVSEMRRISKKHTITISQKK